MYDSISKSDELFNLIPNNVDRAMFVLFYYWGLTYQEIGYAFAVPEELIEQRLSKCKDIIGSKFE